MPHVKSRKHIGRTRLLNLKNGQRIDSYTITSRDGSVRGRRAVPLGSGGSGMVFLANQELLSGLTTQRAIKFFVYDDRIQDLTIHADSGPISSRNFRDEILNISTFRHENLVAVVGAGFWQHSQTSIPEVPYIVTDFVDGPTLQSAMDNGLLVMELERDSGGILDVILRASAGMAFLHSRGFYHCDFKPANLFLVKEGNGVRPIIGDLGVGRTIGNIKDDDRVLIVGSRKYMPPDIARDVNKEVSGSLFRTYQPRWDLFGFARTWLEAIEWLKPRVQARKTWLEAVLDVLRDQVEEHRYATMDELIHQLSWIHPGQRTIGAIEELSESHRGARRLLLPVEPVVTTHRIREILDHPALHRLRNVPQLTMAGAVFASAVHSRYEHSLGTYQVSRRYLLALQNDKEFLRSFSSAHMEVLLVSALLSNASRFPFSSIIHEIRGLRKEGFDGLTRKSILERALKLKDDRGRVIADVLSEYFPQVAIDKVLGLLTDDPQVRTDAGYMLVHFLLNSSIDARVLDYLLRDSLHLGIGSGTSFDLGELLRHLQFHEGRLLVRSSGLSVVEQVISLRYWLFNRVYWNSPNRSLIAMIKTVLLGLYRKDKLKLEELLRKVCLSATESKMLFELRTLAKDLKLTAHRGMCESLLKARPKTFKEIDQFTLSDGDNRRRSVCDQLASLSAFDLYQLQNDVNADLRIRLDGIDGSLIHVLIDVPIEPGIPKLGEDLDVETYDGNIVPLQELSGIVTGVQASFKKHLQRARVFSSPECLSRLEGRQLADIVRELLFARVGV